MPSWLVINVHGNLDVPIQAVEERDTSQYIHRDGARHPERWRSIRVYRKSSLAVIFGESLQQQGTVALFPHRQGKHFAHAFEKTKLNVRLIHQLTEVRKGNRGLGTRNRESDGIRDIQVCTERDLLAGVAGNILSDAYCDPGAGCRRAFPSIDAESSAVTTLGEKESAKRDKYSESGVITYEPTKK